MINRFIQFAHRHRLLLFFVSLSCMLSIGLAFFRFYVTDTLIFSFLLWNLFLAAIPMGFAALFCAFNKDSNKLVMVTVLGMWLLFFPNTPYILTDLLHLYPRRGVPFWYDLVLIFTFAWNGVMLGYLSLLFIHNKIELFYGKVKAWFFSLSALSMGAFGIYLGRFDRWNSWDILQEPIPLIKGIATYFVHPYANSMTWFITGVIAAFLITGYAFIRQLSMLGFNFENIKYKDPNNS
ncbi:MAG: DUF1361 domain-containing protein [Sphingobacteriales bacterium JAD_PAG50586_3]|nr:MAG: DUF1361 domain-containing protein [Sphingobacteriales bacterium JAD_PAG50586_3]